MSRILVESANQLYSVMVQLKEKTNLGKKDLKKIADTLEEFFRASLLKAVEEVEETAALGVLLQLKLDPNVKYVYTYHSSHGKAGSAKATPLYIACQQGNAEAVRVLLQHQADPNIPSSDNKKTPLMVACSNTHAEVVKVLLAHRATDVEALDETHDTALRYANDQNSTEIVRLLLESAHANPNVYGRNDWSCLLVSCCDGYLNNVVLLLEHGADPYHKVKGGKTCLMMASQNGHIDIVRLLLNSKRVDIKKLINVQTEAGWTALALSYKHPKIVELLLENGADPNLHTNDGWTPLLLACQREGIPTTAEVLLNPKYQVDIEHKSRYGLSAYGLASRNKEKVIVEMLNKKGAKKRSVVGDMVKSVMMLPVDSLMRKFGSKTESSPVISVEPHVDETIAMSSLPRSADTAIATDGTGGEMQQPKQDQADVLKVNHKQMQLTIKEIKREMEGLGNITFTFESSTLEARDKLAKIQEKIKYVKQVVLSEGMGTEKGGSTESFTAAEVIDAYDVSLRATQRTLEAAQHEATISKQECMKLENKINEMEKEKAVLRHNYEQQADQLETLQRKVAGAKLAVEMEVQVDTLSDVIQEYKEKLQASEEEVECLLQASELKQKMERVKDVQILQLKTAREPQEKVAGAKLAVEVEVQVDTLSDVIQDYKERLQASEEEVQHLLQASESKQKMERARDTQISNLKTTQELQEKRYNESLIASKAEMQHLLQVLELRQKMEHARDAQILRLKTLNKVLQKKCDELIADDDDKQQQLLNYVIQVCRPSDWQISLLENRLAKKQLVQAQQLSDETYDVHKKMLIVKYENEHQQKELKRLQWKNDALEASYLQLKATSNEKKSVSVDTVDTGVQADYLAVAPGFLRGVEVYRETVFEVVGDKPQKLEWPGYGFFMEVPDGALASGVTASVGVRVILSGQFKLPDNKQLISAIYWISSSEIFLKEVAINIQHFAVIKSEEQCTKCSFIIAKCSQKDLPYTFREREGSFNPHTHYGAIKLKQFSLIAEIGSKDTDLRFTSLQFYKPTSSTLTIVDYIFAVVYNHEVFLEYTRKEYHGYCEDKQNQFLVFDDDDVMVLDLPADDSPPKVVDGWKILPLTHPQIAKVDIREFKRGTTLPVCTIELEWTGSGEPKRLSHKVNIIGAKKPNNYFYMRYSPQEYKSTADSSSKEAAAHEEIATGGQISGVGDSDQQTLNTSTRSLPSTPTCLLVDTKPDLATLSCFKYKDEKGTTQRIYILDDIAAKWWRVGLGLKFQTSTLDNIESTCNGDVEKCSKRLLTLWLEGNVTGVPITWKTFTEAITDARLGNLADKLKELLQS